MSRHVVKKGIQYFKKNGFKKSCKRTVYFFMDRQLYGKLMKYTEPTQEELMAQRNTILGYTPKISIIIPMYNTPVNFFKELVDSIMEQTYSNWELCLADGTGKDTEASELIKKMLTENEFAAEHIKYKMLESNDGISGNTNGALAMATGEFVALVDHDDIITRDALYHVVKAINDNPEVDSVYSDEDKMDYEGRKFFEPHFKPDFNVCYLENGNYICHLFVTRTEIARKDGFRKEFDGAQDFDFIFRCTESSRAVAHVPRVLYHWRCHPNSTAAHPESKMYAYEAGVKSIQEHWNRLGINATAQMGPSFGYYKSTFEISGNPLVSVISAKGFNRQLTHRFTYENIEYIQADSYTPNAVNQAVGQASGEYLLLVDPRVDDISPDAVEQLLGYTQREDVAVSTARVNGNGDKVYHAGIVIGIFKNFGYAFRQLDKDNHGYFMRLICPQNVSAVDMSCTMIKKSVLDSIGAFDENMDMMYSSVDYCLRIEKKFEDNGKCVYNPYAAAHIAADTEDTNRDDNEEKLFNNKWQERLSKGDRYYNENLTRSDSDFGILSWAELKERMKAH